MEYPRDGRRGMGIGWQEEKQVIVQTQQVADINTVRRYKVGFF